MSRVVARFCTECGAAVEAPVQLHGKWRQPCPACGVMGRGYPKVLVSCFITCGKRLLWMRRRLEPKAGFWALPAGFLENGETLAEGAARELWEETGVRLAADDLQLYMMGTITFINEVYIAFRAAVSEESGSVGEEALEIGWFTREELPWDEVAHPSANNAIEQCYNDLERGEFGVYHAQMTPDRNVLDPVVVACTPPIKG